MVTEKTINEAITSEHELVTKLSPLSETAIFEFMQNLRGGTFFNMGMYSFIPVSRAYKKTMRIYKVINLTAIVSGVSYENIGTTKDFRDSTGKGPGSAWYDHMVGYENKIGVKKSDPNSKYILWDIKESSGNWVRYFVVDIATGAVQPVSREDVMNSNYLTPSEKARLTPKKVEGYDKTTGALVENQTNWRTAAFEHIFWLSQSGKNTKEYGTRFVEDICATPSATLEEAHGSDIFRDAHANVATDLDTILSGGIQEAKELNESVDELYESLVALFWEGLAGWSWESWEAAGASDREEVAEYAMNSADFAVDEDVVYELFWDWANNLTESDFEEPLSEGIDIFKDAHANIEDKLDNILSGNISEDAKLTESYRRTVSRGNNLVDNDMFVNFD